jgi:hypothetical protein
VSRLQRRSAAVAAGAIAAIAVTVAPGMHRAAADPPGFPSNPNGQPAPQNGQPAPQDPAAAAKAAQAEAMARERITALKKFVRDNEADARFAEREGPRRACRLDHDRKLATLTFNADGTLHCRLNALAEGYEFEIQILTVKQLYAGGNHYRVTVAPGAPLKAVPIHGSSDDVKAEIAVLSGLLHEDYTQAEWWLAPVHYGPYHFDSGTITIALDEAGVTQDTRITIEPLYPLALSVLAIAGPGVPSYSIANGKIAQSLSRADLAYYFGVHLYPFSWNRDGKNHLMPGRYFNADYAAWYDRISLLIGVNLTHPTEAGFLGGAVEVYPGIALTAGWQPRKYNQLHTGYAVGDMIMADPVPTDAVWKLNGWAAGISMDASMVKMLLAYVGR